MQFSLQQIALLLIFTSVSTAVKLDAQVLEKPITLHIEDQEISKALRKIEKQADIKFVFSPQVIKAGQKVTLQLEHEKLGTLLDKLLNPLFIKYEVSGKYILLSDIRLPSANVRAETILPNFPQPPLDRTLTGKVSDENGEGLPGVSIVVKGTPRGTISKVDGSYELSLPDGDATLIFSFVGYVSQELVVGNQTSLEVSLKVDEKSLEEVVVIGYGTQRKSDLTGSVVSANLEAFREAPNTNILQSLQGSLPGVQIGQIKQAGESPSISVRGRTTLNGNTNVLIVLDGVIYRGSMSDLNPSDIKSIEVLKDASSKAIYGAQAANGVVLITSKSGKVASRATTINYSTYASLQSPTVKARLLNREEWIQKVKDTEYKGAYLEPDYQMENPDWNFQKAALRGANLDGIAAESEYDWFKEATRRSTIQNHDLSLDGGSDKVSYYVSASHTSQKGVIKNDNFKRNSVRINLEIDATHWMKFGINAFGAFADYSGIYPNLETLMRNSPVVGWKDSEGNYILSPLEDGTINPFFNSLADDRDRSKNISANFYTIVKVPQIPGLSYRLNYANSLRETSKFYSNPYDGGLAGIAYKRNTGANEVLLDNILTYDKSLNADQNIQITLVAGFNTRDYELSSANGQGYSDLSLSYNSLQQASIQTISSSAWDESYLYQMARLNYSFKSKYLLTGTLRRDGFSGFSASNKYAVFPSVGVGWILSEESFLQSSNLDFLKFRASYGQNGNLTDRYSSLAKVNTNSAFYYVFGDGAVTSIGHHPASLANSNLSWERTNELNLGLDFDLFKSRLSGAVDLYNTNTTDLLWDLSIPTLTGFSAVKSNVGKINNKGLEISLNSRIVGSSVLTWELGLNFSTNHNKVVSLLGRDADGDGKEDDLVASGLFIGKSIGTIYHYQVDGIWQQNDEVPSGYQPGSYRIVDQNGDGVISAAHDRVFLGRSEPAYRFGIQNTLRIRDFTFRFFINSVQGGRDGYLSANNPYRASIGDIQNRNWFNFYELWSPRNPDVKYEAGYTSPAIRASRYFSRSFVRLQDISLAYNVPDKVLNKILLKNLKLFISGKNLVTLTKWDGWDPETGQGIHTSDNFPVLKSLTAGLDIRF